MGASVTVGGLRPGDLVLGCVVIENVPVPGTDGEVTRHTLVVEDTDGNTRITVLPRARRFTREGHVQV